MNAIHQLPEDKAKAISDFADFMLKQYEEQLLSKGMTDMVANSRTFEFLNDEEDLYTEADMKKPFISLTP